MVKQRKKGFKKIRNKKIMSIKQTQDGRIFLVYLHDKLFLYQSIYHLTGLEPMNRILGIGEFFFIYVCQILSMFGLMEPQVFKIPMPPAAGAEYYPMMRKRIGFNF